MHGERLAALVPPEALKLAAGVILLSPFLPLLFMGEEYGETAPFQYFVSHTDPGLVEAVRRGRKEEFVAFGWEGEPPDPQDEATFLRSRVDQALRRKGRHKDLQEFYRELIRLRKQHPALRHLCKRDIEVEVLESERVLAVRRWCGTAQALAVFRFADSPAAVSIPCPAG